MPQGLARRGKPAGERRRPFPVHRLPRARHILQGMGELQHAHGIRPVQVHEALDPLGPIAHRPHRPRRLRPPSVRFHQCQAPEGRGIAQARKIGQLRRMHDPLPPLLPGRLDRPARQGLDRRPRPGLQRDHRPLHTEPLQPGAWRCWRQLALDALYRRCWDGFVRRPSARG